MKENLSYKIYITGEPAMSELSFQQIKGIASFHFNGRQKMITIAIDEKYNDAAAEILQEVAAVIRKSGGEVKTEKIIRPVLNMTCSACASSTQNILSFVPGVLAASVNYGNGKIGYDLLIEEEEVSFENLEHLREENYIKLRRDTIWAVGLAVPLVIIGMFFMYAPFANIAMWLLATPALFIFGRRFFVGAWKQAKHHTANMDTLVALSTGIAYLFSLFNMLYPRFWENRGLEAHVYFEAAGVIIAFILLGKLLEARARGNTSEAIRKLMGLQPSTVIVFRDGKPEEIPIEEVLVGDIVLVKPGDKIAVDGEVTEGSSFVDESMISGEPIHVEKLPGEKVYAGTVDEAQGSKAPVQGLVDRIAGVFVPVVIIIALLSFVVWVISGGGNGFVFGLMAMVTVLVIACPCALGLATPTAIMVGIGKGAEEGILIKDAESLEMTKDIDVVVLDKTGTITEGRPQVSSVMWEPGILTFYHDIFYSIEYRSEHPLADAITGALKENCTLLGDVTVQQVSGRGIEGRYNGLTYYVGNEQFIKEKNILISSELQRKIDEELNVAHTVSLFADEKKAYGVVGITDKMKPTSREAIDKLRDMGIDVAIYTGDNEKVAAALAKELGITHYKGSVLPEEKAEMVKELQQKGKKVAMVGDGINDSGALAQADVSIAMGAGSDIAMDVAKMTIISSDLNKIPKAIQLSRATVKTIRLSSVSVVTNSLRLKNKKI